MAAIENAVIVLDLDPKWPRILQIRRKDTQSVIFGCDPSQPFSIVLNELHFGLDDVECVGQFDPSLSRAIYNLRFPSVDLELQFQFVLKNEEIVFTLPKVIESGSFRLETLYIPEHRLVTGLAQNNDSYLRFGARKVNWSRSWCPGTGFYNMWEDFGQVEDGNPEPGAQITNHACVWNEHVCAAITCSTMVQPLMSALDAHGQKLKGRAGRFSIWAGPYSYRLNGKTALPLEVRIALLRDYNGNGVVDWCDAAAWEGDYWYQDGQRYQENIVYTMMIDLPDQAAPVRRFSDCLKEIEELYCVSGGLKQIVYLVGWQSQGHDTGYPCHTEINERAGGLSELIKLMEASRSFNCNVSLHGNLDDAYEAAPEFDQVPLSQDHFGKPFVWFRNRLNETNVYSVNHTCATESGYNRSRMERLLDLLPLKETIHFDAFRPYNERWETDGTYIGPESEVQHGMLPIMQMWRDRGIDVTAEGLNTENRGMFAWVNILPHWLHYYSTVMAHGRVGGHWRMGMPRDTLTPQIEGTALGLMFSRWEDAGQSYDSLVEHFYTNWMYAQILYRKKMVYYQTGDWDRGLLARYEDDTWVQCDRGFLLAWYEGIPIARGSERFLPWRETVIFAYSKSGGPQEWTLPKNWVGKTIKTTALLREGEKEGPVLTVEGQTVRFLAEPGLPYKIERLS